MQATFHWPIRVYYEDTDTGGVVFYANYLKFFERARTEWLRLAGISQHALAMSEQVMFVVKNTSIDYHSPAKLDDSLSISVQIEKLGRASINFVQQAMRISEDGAPELLCTCSIRIGCVGTETLRPEAIPATVLASIRSIASITTNTDTLTS
jgi:acyl-CoA thioester hydrolase